MTDLDNKENVSLNTLYDPNTKEAFQYIVYNENELNHNHIAARVDFVLSELSDFLKVYSGNDKKRAIEDFFKTFGQQLTFDGGLNNAAVPATLSTVPAPAALTNVTAATNVASAPVPAMSAVPAATNAAATAATNAAASAVTPVVPVASAAETAAFKEWLLNLINKRLAYDGKTVINIDRDNAVLNAACPQTAGTGLGESHAFLTGVLNGLGLQISDKFKITGDFADDNISVMNNSHIIMINNGAPINEKLFEPKDSTKPIELSDYVIFNYTTIKPSGDSNKYQIPPTNFNVNGTSYYRTGIVYHVKSSNDATLGEINHYTTLLGINDKKYYIDDDKVYKITGYNDSISVKLISPKQEVGNSTDNADNAGISASLNTPLDYIKTVIKGDYLPELVFYKKSSAIP